MPAGRLGIRPRTDRPAVQSPRKATDHPSFPIRVGLLLTVLMITQTNVGSRSCKGADGHGAPVWGAAVPKPVVPNDADAPLSANLKVNSVGRHLGLATYPLYLLQ